MDLDISPVIDIEDLTYYCVLVNFLATAPNPSSFPVTYERRFSILQPPSIISTMKIIGKGDR